MDIFLHYIMPPLIGAIIGYVTNWIAVKMLFRPLYPKYIGKCKIPFTPGIIPARKDALASAIGKAVGERLFTQEDITNSFKDEEKKNKFIDGVYNKLEETKEDTIDNMMNKHYTLEDKENKKQAVAEFVSKRAMDVIPQLNLGQKIAEVAESAVMEKIGGSPIAFFVKDSMVHSIAMSMAEKINAYIEEHGEEQITPVLNEKINELSEISIDNVLASFKLEEKQIKNIIGVVYDNILLPFVSTAVGSLNISDEVGKKIEKMDVKELEELCLSVMKKELNAITWLGGLIGLILGTINIFI